MECSAWLPMETAPNDRPIMVYANQAPFDETMFVAKAHRDPIRGWVVKDEPPHGLPSLGLIPINPIPWAPLT